MKKSKETVDEKESGFASISYDLFRSRKLTISLLVLLAILSIIGTVITQNATRPEYIQRYGPGLYEVLNFFNLFDMYHSWWFSAILLLLVINLISARVRVEGFSMLPTLENNEYVLVSRLTPRFFDLKRGDIIVFRPPMYPDAGWLERVLGFPTLPGQ